MTFINMFPKSQKSGRILVTGGAGYIGSHTTLALLQNGYRVVVVDNLCNSFKGSVSRVRQLAECKKKDLIFIKGNVHDRKLLESVFRKHKITAVIHFAGLKAVSESIEQPLLYYHNNVHATCILLEVMLKHGCHRIVFSSSATVYGNTDVPYITESEPAGPLTPYGRSKLMCEQVITDTCTSAVALKAAVLRYFNPVGCHPSGLLGENPKGRPNNLMPCVTNAMHSRVPMKLFGTDYSTEDGTAVRDFIHVMDLADGHVRALQLLEATAGDKPFCQVYNMGNGHGNSVRQVIQTMDKVTGVHVPYKVEARRPGDAECVVANPAKANLELSWYPSRDLSDMCESAWRWKRDNPQGYSVLSEGLFSKCRRVFLGVIKA